MRRDWRRYSRDSLNLELSKVNWSTDFDCVQSYWNAFENMLIVVVDKVAPMVLFVNNSIKQRPPQIIKQKMNTRKRLLKAQKINPCNHWRDKIKVLNHEIKVQSTY